MKDLDRELTGWNESTPKTPPERALGVRPKRKEAPSMKPNEKKAHGEKVGQRVLFMRAKGKSAVCLIAIKKTKKKHLGP